MILENTGHDHDHDHDDDDGGGDDGDDDDDADDGHKPSGMCTRKWSWATVAVA